MKANSLFATMIAVATLATSVSPSMAAGLGGLTKNLGSAPAVRYIVASRPTLAPFAHVVFCMQSPRDCQTQGNSRQVALDRVNWRLLQAVNRSVNRSIRPVNDRTSSMGADTWSLSPRSGDCEDFAITKRHRLIAMGWPSAALRLAVARTGNGEGHAVLVIKTDRGDMVLDNRTNAIRPFQNTDLVWEKIQSAENPRMWLAL